MIWTFSVHFGKSPRSMLLRSARTRGHHVLVVTVVHGRFQADLVAAAARIDAGSHRFPRCVLVDHSGLRTRQEVRSVNDGQAVSTEDSVFATAAHRAETSKTRYRENVLKSVGTDTIAGTHRSLAP